MKLPLYNVKGESKSEIDVLDSVFDSKVNKAVLAQYVRVYLFNQRQSNASTKDKSEVSGGGKKPWKQKGTGRARAGTIRSPLWRGGGVTFGPTPMMNWKRRLTKSIRIVAFRSAFSNLLKSDSLKLISNVEFVKPSTKEAIDLVKSFNNPKKLTIVTGKKNENLIKSLANIKNSKVITVTELNVYDLLNAGFLLLEESALEYINIKWA